MLEKWEICRNLTLHGEWVFPALADQATVTVLRNPSGLSFPNNPTLPQPDSPSTHINVCETQEVVFLEASRMKAVEGQAVCCLPLPRTIWDGKQSQCVTWVDTLPLRIIYCITSRPCKRHDPELIQRTRPGMWPPRSPPGWVLPVAHFPHIRNLLWAEWY